VQQAPEGGILSMKEERMLTWMDAIKACAGDEALPLLNLTTFALILVSITFFTALAFENLLDFEEILDLVAGRRQRRL
jgi:hypothetical protein